MGEWEIGLHPRHLGMPLDPALGARQTVVVVEASADATNVTLLAVLATLAALGAIAYLRITRRRPSARLGEP